MKTTIFFGINDVNRDKLVRCLSAEQRRYSAGETILGFKKTMHGIGVILSGRAHLSCLDPDGNERILEYYSEDDVFGEMFYAPLESMEYYITADSGCDVMYIDYGHIVKRCENACNFHSQLVSNLFRILAEKLKTYTLHISILGQKNLRKKLLAYLEYQSVGAASSAFTIPITLSELSSYLCVDRCALMREIKSLKDDGLILSKGRTFKILQKNTAL